MIKSAEVSTGRYVVLPLICVDEPRMSYDVPHLYVTEPRFGQRQTPGGDGSSSGDDPSAGWRCL